VSSSAQAFWDVPTQPNSNRGWRTITVRLSGKNLQKYHLRTRDGYRILHRTQVAEAGALNAGSASASQ
jgi:hypothetical protein